MLNFQKRVVRGWESLVQAHAPRRKIALAPLLDLVLAIEAHGPCSNDLCFVAVVVGTGKWFRYEAQLGFLKYATAAGSPGATVGGDYRGVRLAPDRQPFVPPAPRDHNGQPVPPPRPVTKSPRSI